MDKWTLYLAVVGREGVKVLKFKQQKTLEETIQTGKEILSSIKNSEIDDNAIKSIITLYQWKVDKSPSWDGDYTSEKLPDDLDAGDGNRVLFTVFGVKTRRLYVRVRREGKVVSRGRKNRGLPVSGAAQIRMALSPRAARAPRAKIDKVFKCRKVKNQKCRYVSRVNKDDGMDKKIECQKENKQCLLMSARKKYRNAQYLTQKNWEDIWKEVHTHTEAEAEA